MSEKKVDAADVSFVIRAVIYWILTALPTLLLASLLLALTKADGTMFAYASASVSFIAAAAAGTEAARTRRKKALATGILTGVVITTALLMTGFVITGNELAPDGVLSVSAFSIAGATAGSLLQKNVTRRIKKRPGVKRVA